MLSLNLNTFLLVKCIRAIRDDSVSVKLDDSGKVWNIAMDNAGPTRKGV